MKRLRPVRVKNDTMGKGADGILSPVKSERPAEQVGGYDPLKLSLDSLERTRQVGFAIPSYQSLSVSLARQKDLGVIKEINSQKRAKGTRRLSLGTRPSISKVMKCKDLSLVFRDAQRIMGDFNLEEKFRDTLQDLKTKHIESSSSIRALRQKLNEYENFDLEAESGQRGEGQELRLRLDEQNTELSKLEETAEEKRGQIAEIQAQLEKAMEDKAEWDSLVKEDIALDGDIVAINDGIAVSKPVLGQRRAEVRDYESVVAAMETNAGEDNDNEDSVGELTDALKQNEARLQRLQDAVQRREQARACLLASDPCLLDMSTTTESLEHQIENASSTLSAEDQRAAAISRAIESALAHASTKSANPFATALLLMFEHSGQMMLKELKEELCRRHPSLGSPMGGGVLQTIYSLVANNAIKIDRSTVENTVLLLI